MIDGSRDRARWTLDGERLIEGSVSDSPEVSVVVPCHNEEGNLRLLVDSIRDAIGSSESYEVVLVDDGSTDSTWDAIIDLAKANTNITGLRLTRGFGQQAALLAGLESARGRAVVSMDADLQHPPSTIPALLASWRAGAKIVHTRRVEAKETTRMKRWTSRWFYAVFSRLSGVSIAPGSSDFRLLDRQVVQAILATDEGEYFLRGLVNWMGFPSATVSFVVASRFSGSSAYSPKRMARFAVSGIVSFSVVPLRLGVGLGLLTALAAFAYLVYVLIMVLGGRTVPGWASAVGVTTLLFGIQFVLIGLLGEYLGRVHVAIKRRPPYLVSERTPAIVLERRPLVGTSDVQVGSSR